MRPRTIFTTFFFLFTHNKLCTLRKLCAVFGDAGQFNLVMAFNNEENLLRQCLHRHKIASYILQLLLHSMERKNLSHFLVNVCHCFTLIYQDMILAQK